LVEGAGWGEDAAEKAVVEVPMWAAPGAGVVAVAFGCEKV